MAIDNALRLQPSLPEAHLAYAIHLYRTYRDYERARVQLAIARRSLTNSAEAMGLEAATDRRQGNFERAIQELKAASTLDPRDLVPMINLAVSYSWIRQFSAADEAYDRTIELAPDRPMLKVQKANANFLKTGDDTPVRATIAALPKSMADDRSMLAYRLNFALIDRNWPEAIIVIDKMRDGFDEISPAIATACKKSVS